MGNHEINLLREDAKEGAGWFFGSRREKDHANYEPYKKVSDAARDASLLFWPRYLSELSEKTFGLYTQPGG